MGAKQDFERPRSGGRYVVEDGKAVLKTPPARQHAQGDRARNAKGEALKRPERVRAPKTAAQPPAGGGDQTKTGGAAGGGQAGQKKEG